MEKIQVISECFLFKSVDCERLQDYLSLKWYDKRKYGKGAFIEQPNNHIGILLKGQVDVQRLDLSGKRTIINRLNPMDVFGMVDLFLSDTCAYNHLVSYGEATVAYLNGQTLLEWFQKDPVLLKNYMVHVHSRIRFLNQRIECFTYSDFDERVAHHMFIAGNHNFNMSETAEFLGMSRASLYRSIARIKKRTLTD